MESPPERAVLTHTRQGCDTHENNVSEVVIEPRVLEEKVPAAIYCSDAGGRSRDSRG